MAAVVIENFRRESPAIISSSHRANLLVELEELVKKLYCDFPYKILFPNARAL
jgi:hypothetical protein